MTPLISGHRSSCSRLPPCPHQIHSIREAVEAARDVLEPSNSVWPLRNYRFFPFLQRKMTSTFVPEGQRLCCPTTCRLRNHWNAGTCAPLGTRRSLSSKPDGCICLGRRSRRNSGSSMFGAFLKSLCHFLRIIVSRRDQD